MKNLRFGIFLLIVFPLFSFSQIKYFRLPENVGDTDYIAKTIILNVKEDYRGQCSESGLQIEKISKATSAIGAYEIKKKFPGKKQPIAKLNKYGEKMEDLSLLYELKYNNDVPIENAINTLLATGVFEYAEPHYIPHLLYVPNDPKADTTNPSFNEFQLKCIKAYQAWEIQKGDTNIVIGITDTGVDLYHPDLYGNIKKNYLDPINGIDDDGDGFKDNFFGWDMAENDSCPQWEVDGHGAFVSGCSSAIPDNGEGVAGTGFNAKFLPVKISDASGALIMAYEGVVYAADHGCSVINCSWGSQGGAGIYGQTVVNYATNNCDALVVAACGNAHNDNSYYPASYDNVISVGATYSDDCFWNDDFHGTGSSYGLFVDLSAPGVLVSSTWVSGGYATSTGTSFAAPIVCGAAALVKSHYPTYSALQIGEQLKLTTDNIDTLDCNEGKPYSGQMGTGRLNMYKALTTTNIPSIVMISHTVTDNNDEAYVANDTLRISGMYKNYLGPSSANLIVTLSSTNPYVSVLPAYNFSTLGNMGTFATTDNYGDPFLVKILPGVPVSTQIDFKVTFEDLSVSYQASQNFSVIVNLDYINIDTNLLGTTVTSRGKIGYNLDDDYSQGLGYTYDNSQSYLAAGGFLVGIAENKVSDNLYGEISGNYDEDFEAVDIVHTVVPEVKSDFETECVFNDDQAPAGFRLNVTVTHKTYTWTAAPDDKYIIMEYTIKNTGIATLNNLYAGLFMDFDMSDGLLKDIVDYDAGNMMGYTYSLLGGPLAAIKLLSSGSVHHYAFDKDGATVGTSTSFNILDGFTSNEKYKALKINQSRNTTSSAGNDVADMISTGPYIITSGDSIVVAFALIVGDHLADIQNSAQAADDYYNHYGINEFPNENISSLQVYPNPACENIYVSFEVKDASVTKISVVDINGKQVYTEDLGNIKPGVHQETINTAGLSSGNYSVIVSSGTQIISNGFTIVK
jgi:serine protease